MVQMRVLNEIYVTFCFILYSR